MLEVAGMTFVASRDSEAEVRLRAAQARFHPADDVAELDTVHATVAGDGDTPAFEVRCDRGSLDLEANDFWAEGNVVGSTEDGREFETTWVRYDHARGILFTDAPVLIKESGTSMRGGGFRYYVRERRFRVLGGASVVQE